MTRDNDTDLQDFSILDSIPHGYMALEKDRIVYMNRTLRSIFGDRYELLSELVERFPEVAFFEAQTSDEQAARWVDLDGSLFRIRRFNAGNKDIIFFLPGRFLAESDSDLANLQQAYDDFVEIFQNSFDGIYVADGQGKTLWINEGFERCYGLSARNFIGRNATELERQGYIKPLITWKVITTKKRTTELQQTKSGRHVLATGIPLFDNEGEVRKVIINSRDTTELLELKARLDDAEQELEKYESELARLRVESIPGGDIVWEGQPMQKVIDLAHRVAEFDTTLLVTGESGVGKEVIAKFIHARSPRNNQPFMQINCGAIPGDLLESELFGHEEGAFTGASRKGKKGLFELADHGTLFLDEVGELPLELQVKLLRALQDQKFTRVGGTEEIETDFRIIAATNRELRELVEKGQFREDLFYRLSVVPIEVPPLRERPEDVIGLSFHFLNFYNEKYGFDKKLSADAMDIFVHYNWRGNVRELKNLIERLIVTCPDDVITATRLPDDVTASVSPSHTQQSEIREGELKLDKLKSMVGEYEARLIKEAVDHFGSIRKTASATGISESTIKRKLKSANAP
jgi:PAS domain S-box-containing protein